MLTYAMQADLVLESIGYRSLPLAGAPFDEQRGVIPNRYQPTVGITCTMWHPGGCIGISPLACRQGRVLRGVEDSTAVAEGLYVCGWVKRGPSGIIGTDLKSLQPNVSTV